MNAVVEQVVDGHAARPVVVVVVGNEMTADERVEVEVLLHAEEVEALVGKVAADDGDVKTICWSERSLILCTLLCY